MFLSLDTLPVALIALDTRNLGVLSATRKATMLPSSFWRALAKVGVWAMPRGVARGRFVVACRRAMRSGYVRTLLAFAVPAEQGLSYWDISLSLVYTDGDTPAHLLVALVNVTETVRLRQAMAMQEQELHCRANDLDMLNATGQAITGSLDLPTVLERVLALLNSVVRYDRASVAVITPDGTHLQVICDTAPASSQLGQLLPIAETLRGYVFISGQPLHLAYVTAHTLPITARLPLHEYPASLILAPLIASDRVIGTLSVLSNTPGELATADAARVARITAPIAIAVANARLYEEARVQFDELRLLNIDLAEANRHKSIFLATMSHELRTPLNAIIGFGELLADGLIEDPKEQQQSLIDIVRSGQHLLTLINDVLDLARVEAGELKVRRYSFALAGELTSTIRVMQTLFSRRAQTFHVHIPPDLPTVDADPERTRQVVLHLLTNAHKFTPDGGTITLVADVNAAGEMEIRVTDTGIGIRPEDAPLVWQEFRQLDTSVSRRFDGTGLGLTLVKRLLDLMGGQVWFESELGRGTTFFVTLPLIRDLRTVTLTAPELAREAD